MKQVLRLRVNGQDQQILVEPYSRLVDVLREDLFLTGTKSACNSGSCGACTVLIDGKAVKSCTILAWQAQGKDVLTIEGLDRNGLHPVQQAFIERFAFQCGFCTPGMILMAKALLDENPDPTEEEIRQYLTGNICRCTGYVKIVEAVQAAKEKMRDAV
jgi:xanthine dehydrogenase E subunit